MLIVQWLHVTSAVIWLGGKIFSSFVLNPVLRFRVPKEVRSELLKGLGGRFRYISWGSLFILVATGGVLAVRRVSGLSEWLHSDFGSILLVKLFLVAAMIAISAGHTIFLTPWARKKSGGEDEGEGKGSREARKVLILVSRTNIVLGALVILLAVML